MRYSVCVSSVFRGLPIAQALRRVKAAGADAYEFWAWWDQDLEALSRLQQELRLQAAAFCTRFVPMNDQNRQEEYLQGLYESIKAAQLLQCGTLITQAGQDLPDTPREAQEEQIIRTLQKAVPLLEDAGCTLALEPLNTQIDHKGHFLEKAEEAFRLVRAADSPRIKVLYDIYHQHITECSPVEDITRNIDLIAHFHLAGYPGRHEPWFTSHIDYQHIIKQIECAGYIGLVGLEYFPSGEDTEGELKRFISRKGE